MPQEKTYIKWKDWQWIESLAPKPWYSPAQMQPLMGFLGVLTMAGVQALPARLSAFTCLSGLPQSPLHCRVSQLAWLSRLLLGSYRHLSLWPQDRHLILHNDSVVTGYLPEDVPTKHSIVLCFWGWLPLDHDGLIGTPTGHYIFWGSTGWFLR